jgi:hypothetical protein
MAKEPKKTADVQAEAVKQAEEAAEVSGTGSPAREPEKSKMPEPGLTEDTAEIINTDQSHSLNPNVTVSGTKPVGDGTYQLLDTVDPSVANAALLPPRVARKPENPSLPPEDNGKPPKDGEVKFRCTADNEPFYSGGPMQKDEIYFMTKEEAELLVQTKAGSIEGSSPPPRDDNARVDGSDVV